MITPSRIFPVLMGLAVPVVLGLACGTSAPAAAPTSAPSLAQAAQALATQAQAPSTVATNSERGTPDEARTMLELAIERYQSVGRDQALADFNAGQPPFIDRDLYVVCLGPDAIETANGAFPQYVGTSADALTSADGQLLGQAILKAASSQDIGSVSYRWVSPVSGVTEPKVIFVKNLGQDVCGVGAYNPPG